GAVFPARLFAHAHDHAAHHFALFDGRIRRGFLNAGRHHVAESGTQTEIAASRQDALQLASAAVIGYVEPGAHPNHNLFLPPFGVLGEVLGRVGGVRPGTTTVASRSTAAGSTATCTALRTMSPSRQRFSLLIGRHSIMRTTSPIFAALCSSCA